MSYRVKDDILLPQDVDLAQPEMLNRGFTAFSPFAASVQAAYLQHLANLHISDMNKGVDQMAIDGAKMDAALQSYIGALIPPAYVSLLLNWCNPPHNP